MFHARLICIGGLTALVAASPVQAQEADKNALALSAQSWLQTQAKAAAGRGNTPLRVKVNVGTADARLKLAPCDQVEHYFPAGAQAWGNTRVGVRCVDGVARWNITVPAQVQAWGTAWVVQNPVLAGNPIQESDLTAEEVDWAAQADAVVTERAQWAGQLAARPLNVGQTLRRSMLKPAQVLAMGSTVRVVAQGPGFAVSTEAQALSAGAVGQAVRVRLEGGRIASGTVVDSRTVRMDL